MENKNNFKIMQVEAFYTEYVTARRNSNPLKANFEGSNF